VEQDRAIFDYCQINKLAFEGISHQWWCNPFHQISGLPQVDQNKNNHKTDQL
jgi:hypothetical protein